MIIGILPPPYNGQAMALNYLISALALHPAFTTTIVEQPKASQPTYPVPLGRFIAGYIMFAVRVCVAIGRRPDVLYLQLGQSRSGIVRDQMILSLARLTNIRAICHLHGGNLANVLRTLPHWFQAIASANLSRCSATIVLGDTLRPSLPRSHQQLNIRVVHNGVPAVCTSHPKCLPDDPSGVIVLLYCSSLIESKGYLTAIAVAGILFRTYGLNVHLDLCGAYHAATDDLAVNSYEDCRNAIAREISLFKLGDRVTVHGEVLGDRKRDIFRRAHFFLLPTSYINEGEPICLIEAQSAGLVAVATAWRGIPDVVHDSTDGVLVDRADAKLMAQRIASIVRQPEMYLALSKAAIRNYLEQFTLERHAAAMLPLLSGN